MNKNEGLWQVGRFIVGATALFTLAIAAAATNHVVVFSGSRDDLIVVMLAAATLVLTGVAVAVGVLALWGYREIKDRLIEASKVEVRQVAEAIAKEAAAPIAARTAREATQPALDQMQAALESLQAAQATKSRRKRRKPTEGEPEQEEGQNGGL